MIPIGHYSTLSVLSRDRYGLRLGDGTEEVLLPNKHVPPGAEVGGQLRVFVYTDSEDTPIATTQAPLATVGEFACLRVVDVGPHGAFLDWGLDKDLFAPKAEQHRTMRVGERHVVAVYLDERTDRVAAAGRLGEFFDYDVADLVEGAPVEFLVYDFNERGALIVVDERYSGIIYGDDIATPLEIGSRGQGYLRAVRDDNKLDVALKRPGAEGLADAEAVILEALRRAGGALALTDKSPPEAVRAALGMSKKTFKAALGGLYRKRHIELHPEGVRLRGGH